MGTDELLSLSAVTRARPSPVPTTMPITAPNTEIITDSERTMDRIWRRFMPTARSSPISLVRSNTDSISVLTIPIESDEHRQGEQGVDEPEQLVDAGNLGRFELGTGLDLHGQVAAPGQAFHVSWTFCDDIAAGGRSAAPPRGAAGCSATCRRSARRGKLPIRAFALKIPPIRIVDAPVRANFTGTLSPTERWSDLAVLESMRRSPSFSAPVLPDYHVQVDSLGQALRSDALERLDRLPDLELAAVADQRCAHARQGGNFFRQGITERTGTTARAA